MSESSCPQCGTPADSLVSIEAGTRLALQSTGQSDVPSAVCPNCYATLMSQVSQGFKLRQETETRNKNKVMMWKNRVNLIKQARTHMQNKSYSHAAVSYEKYLRLIEVVYNLERGGLEPKVFSNSSRSKEMTVIATVYWDLMRIYDSNSGYGDRMRLSAQKLALFLPFSPLYPDVIKKAEQFQRSAKNPSVVKDFLRMSRTGKGPCFIATAVFVDEPWAPELYIFRKFRDDVLKQNSAGRAFVKFYYRHSPALARRLTKSKTKIVLKPMLKALAAAIKGSTID
jgi:hypothetical protein